MTCNDVRRQLAGLDRHEPISNPVRHHLQECSACKKMYKQARRVEEAGFVGGEPDTQLVDRVMRQIETVPAPVFRRHTDDNREANEESDATNPTIWIFGGLLLPVALVVVRFSPTFQFLLGSSFGKRVDLSVTLAIGTTLIFYLAVFVTGNARRLQRTVPRFSGTKDGDLDR